MDDGSGEMMLDDQSDEHLLMLVRGGDATAYGELWRRHAGPALSVARGFTSSDPEDLVSEAFERVLLALRKGGGPMGAFRPYVLAAVRNLGRRQYVRQLPSADVDLALIIDPASVDGEDAAVRELDRTAAGAAFRSLPPRWQEALWYSEVDGWEPRQIATPLGLSANAVSALLVRAKRRFRDAWISAQLGRAESAECRATIADLGAHARGGLSARAAHRVDVHLATCDACTAAAGEARRLAQSVARVILPAVVGTTAAGGYLSTMRAPEMPEMQLPVVTAAAGPSGSFAAEPTSRRRPARVLAVLVLLLLIGGAAGLSIWLREPAPEVGEDAVGVEASPTPTASAPVAPDVATSPSPRPTDAQERGVDPYAEEAQPRNPSVEPIPRAAPTTIVAAPSPGQGAPPSPVRPDALDAALSQSDARMYPRIAGASAVPGALIEVVDGEGGVVASTTADARGAWAARIAHGEPGEGSVRARQTVRGLTSETTAELTYTVASPPILDAPLDGGVVDPARFAFRMTAPAGTVVERQLVGLTPLQTLTVSASGRWNEYLSVDPGEVVIRVRFGDPESGDFGPWSETRVTAE